MAKDKFMSIREASAVYEVSRAKLHRLIKTGRLRSERNPRDERVSLLSTEELEALFRIQGEEGREMRYGNNESMGAEAGRLTAELRANVDALRGRVSAEKNLGDSAEIIREEREKRSRQLDDAIGT